MLKSTKHKKHNLRSKLPSKQSKIINSASIEPTLSITDSNLSTSADSQSLSKAADPQIDENTKQSLPFFEESVLIEYKSKQYTKCIKTIERILKVTPKEQSSHYKILLAAANTMIGKRFKRSHNLLNEVLSQNPFDSYALYGKGVAFYFEGKFEDSVRYFDLAIDVNEDGMEQANEMKTRALVENKQVRVCLEKIKVEVGEKSDEEFDKIIEDVVKVQGILENPENMDLDTQISNTQNNDVNLQKQGEKSGNSVKIAENSTNITNSLTLMTQPDPLAQEKPTRISETENNVIINSEQLTKNGSPKNKNPVNDSSKIGTKILEADTSGLKIDSKIENNGNKAKNNRRTLRSANGSSHEDEDLKLNVSKSSEDNPANVGSKIAQNSPKQTQNSRRSSKRTSKPIQNIQTSLKSSQHNLNPKISPNKFSSESFKQISSKSAINFESSSEDDSADLRPTSSANSFAQVKFNKALDLYMIGELERSLKYFQKSLKYEPDFEEADEMGTKAQEFIDLLDVIDINILEKNYAAVVEICTEGLEIDEGNDAVNRKILFNRGLSYFHLGDNEKSLTDYEEYERLGKKLEVIDDAK